MQKVLVGLSGGVDSAVAAYLLKEQGYEVVAGFMKNYVDEENPNCSTYQDAKDAIKVADFLGIEIISFDLRQEYEDKIVKYIYDGYQKGITPNPDILCNSLIKFEVFLDKAMELGFDKIAMGHYARIEAVEENFPRFLPYNPGLKEVANEMRKNMTKAEKVIWFDCLKKMDLKVLRQKIIGNYIVNFYIASKRLVIEIDGDTHCSQKEIKYDEKRTKELESFGLKVVRFTNTEVYEDLDAVYDEIKRHTRSDIGKNNPPAPLIKGGTPISGHLKKDKKTTPLIKGGTPISGHLEKDKKTATLQYKLFRGVDYNKDQSYFLSGLNQHQLSKSLFPIGGMTKDDVRKLAKKIGLPNADRKDSQGLCFIGKIPMREFLKQRLEIKKGDIVLLDGTKVGEHDGAYFWTIGQSRGLDINQKAYVVKTDIEKNLVYVSYKKQETELLNKEIKVSNWHRIGEKYDFPLDCDTKIRYRQETQKARLFELEDDKLKVLYEDEQWGVAPGQTLTAYIGDECVGSGIIV